MICHWKKLVLRNRVTFLVDICKDENINKNAGLLNEINKVFEENETSELFQPHLTKMKLEFVDARRDVPEKEYAIVGLMN